MGVRIAVGPDETLAEALRRFRKLILAEGAYPLYHCRWHRKRHDFYLKPSILNRHRRWRTRARKKGDGASNPEQEFAWADDLCLIPRRSWGPLGRVVIT